MQVKTDSSGDTHAPATENTPSGDVEPDESANPPEAGSEHEGAGSQPFSSFQEEEDGEGDVRISDDVVGVIAGIAAGEVEGVAEMSGGLVGGLGEMLGKRSPSRGVKVDMKDDECSIDLFMIMEYGVRIPSVAQRVQENVKQAVENMTGLRVAEVNVHVQGVAFPTDADTGENP